MRRTLGLLVFLVLIRGVVAAGNPLYPNEPAGYTPFAEFDGSAIPPSPAGPFQTGRWYAVPTPSRLFVINDPTAPQSPPGVIVTKFPNAWQGGRAPVDFGGWDTKQYQEYDEFYFSMWIKINDTYGDGTYENEDALTKVGWVASGARNACGLSQAENQNFFTLRDNVGRGCGAANPCNEITNDLYIGLNQQGPPFACNAGGGVTSWVNRNIVPATANRHTMTAGPWRHWEAVFTISNPANTVSCGSGGSYCGDGTFTMWMDGVQTMHQIDVAFNSPVSPMSFYSWRWNPTWGGSNNSIRTRDDYLYIDHVYMSGIKKGSRPVNATCGNGVIESGEQCEGSNLNGASCSTQGYSNGTLACNPSTCQYDTSACTNGTNPPSDTTPPVMSSGLPTGTTSSNTLQITTDEPATCKYGNFTNTNYNTKVYTMQGTGTSHTDTLPGLTPGQTYTKYVRCMDTSGNQNTADYTITFTYQTQTKTGDLNNDGHVDAQDVIIVIQKLGQRNITSGEDLNNDGVVDVLDLVMLARNWG